MSDLIYAIVFKGEILEGHQPISVKAHMAKLLKADADKMAALFSGKQVVLKRTPKKEEAIKYASALKKIGADIKVKAVKAPAQAAPAAAAAAAPAPEAASTEAPPAQAPDVSSISLAENDGSHHAPPREIEAVEVDVSGISLSENDDSPLAPPREVEAVEVDISGISVADNDGTPLVEPSAPVPKVDAPDFGLDEPGAVLETLQEDKELVNPDTSGITMAAAGSDLIDELDKLNEPPPPPAPDTSKIHLVPNFDLG